MPKKELAAAEGRGNLHLIQPTLPSAGDAGLVSARADPAAVSTGQTWRRNGKAKLAFS